MRRFILALALIAPGVAWGQQTGGPRIGTTAGQARDAAAAIAQEQAALSAAAAAQSQAAAALPKAGGTMTGSIASSMSATWSNGTAGLGTSPVFWRGSIAGTCPTSPCAATMLQADGFSLSNTSSNGITPLLRIYGNAGGGKGGYTGVDTTLNLNVPTTNTGNTGYYVGEQVTAQVDTNDTGTSGAYSGHLYGYSINARLTGNATYFDQLVGVEMDVAAYAGASVHEIIGQQIVQLGSGARGDRSNIGITLNNDTQSMGWDCGFCFGAYSGYNPMATASTLIGTWAHAATVPGGAMGTVTNGVDLRGYTFTGKALATPGFSVDGAGATTAPSVLTPSVSATAASGGTVALGVTSGFNGINIIPSTGSVTPAIQASANGIAIRAGSSGTGVYFDNSAGGHQFYGVTDGTATVNTNYPVIHSTNAGTGVVYEVVTGPDTNVSWNRGCQGPNCYVQFVGAGLSPNGQASLRVSGVASQTSGLIMAGSTADAPSLGAYGANANVDVALTPKGTGGIALNGPAKHTVGATLTAAGTTQATALALTKDISAFTTVASGSGAILQANIGQRQEVFNRGANALLVYPASGAQIEANAANVSVSIPIGGHAVFECVTATQCYQAP